MDGQLQRIVRDRAEADPALDDRSRTLITAACTQVPLEDASGATWSVDDPTEPADPGRSIFLSGITVEGFRGVGSSRTLELAPGPGLTLVVGRNGSGKSSFAEGLEMCLTGQSTRWQGRHKAWQETWRNLHHPTPSSVSVEVVGLDARPRTLTHAWADGAAVLDGATTLDDGRTLEDLGWSAPLAQYRPLLSFNELGAMFDEPKAMYDAIAEILGVQDVRDAAGVLARARLEDRKPLKAVKDARKGLVERLRAAADPRADAVLAAIEGRRWDLPAALAATVEDTTQPTSDLARLRALVAVDAPHPSDAAAAADALRAAVADRDAAAATDAGRADRVAGLLRQAIACVDHDGPMTCPVCGSDTTLDDRWREGAEQEAAALAAQASAVRAAEERLLGGLRMARRLTPAPPDALDAARFVGIDADAATAAWTALADPPEDPLALADHLGLVAGLHPLVEAVRATAVAELERRQDDWRPLATAVATWVEGAHHALAADTRAAAAEVAEKWLTATAAALEHERFAPISAAVRAYWAQLRLSSNVALSDVQLKRSGMVRSLLLDVTVDDTGASALGVMSQGELHALALSVFLPRATTDASPFGFLVLDDPVQAMDPARVDGLAVVLAEVARTRQVVVMTHDTRLTDAVRRLDIPATVWEVSRRERSEVTLRRSADPVSRYLDDARAMARSTGLPPAVTAQLVAQMGRGALEALAMDIVRRRRLGRGDAHAVVEDALDGRTVHDLLALAMFDDVSRGGDVLPTLRGWFESYPAVVQDCKRGTHIGERQIDDETFVRHLEGLIKGLRQRVA